MSNKPHIGLDTPVTIMDPIMSASYGCGWHHVGYSRKTWRLRLYKFEDLDGRTPPGHPTEVRRERGIAQIDVEQVWVEKGSHGLWFVTNIYTDYRGRKQIEIIPYFPVYDGLSTLIEHPDGVTLLSLCKTISLNNLRSYRRLWDDQVAFLKKLSGVR